MRQVEERRRHRPRVRPRQDADARLGQRSFAAPNGVVFELAPDAVADGLFAAFSGYRGKMRFNLGESAFRHAPPAADFQAFAEFEG